MKQEYRIELLEEYENVNFYSIRMAGKELTDKILVFGNGGVKDSRTWQESETLAPYVKLLVDTSRFISSRIKDGTMVLVDKEIVGNLNFSRYEKE